MKYRYIIIPSQTEAPVGTNNRSVAYEYANSEDAVVIDCDDALWLLDGSSQAINDIISDRIETEEENDEDDENSDLDLDDEE